MRPTAESLLDPKTRSKEVYKRLSFRLNALGQHINEKSCRICFSNEEGDEGLTKCKKAGKAKVRLENPLLAPC